MSYSNDKKLNENIEKIKDNSITLLKLYGLVIPFIFILIFSLFSNGLDLYKLSGKTVYLPRLDAPLDLLLLIFLPPIINIFIIYGIELSKYYEIKLNKNTKLVLLMKSLNLISVGLFFLFIFLTILEIKKVYAHWIDIGIIKEM